MNTTGTQQGSAEVDEALSRLRGPREAVNVLADAAATETVGRRLAQQVRDAHPDVEVLVVWDAPGPSVLAHVVARELGAHVVRAYEIEGLVELADSADAGQPALALGDHFPTENSVNALVGVARSSGLRVVAIASALDSSALTSAGTGLPIVLAASSEA